jgi:hypothetical protein
MGDHHADLFFICRILDNAAVDRDQAVRLGAGIERAVPHRLKRPVAYADIHLAADLDSRRANAPQRTPQGFDHFFIRHEAPHRRPTSPLHLGLSQAEIAPADRRQLMHGTRASADQACPRKSHERPTSHVCALLFLEDGTARESVTAKPD